MKGAQPLTEREFVFRDRDFRELQRLIYDHTRINVAENKREMVYRRLSRRLRALGLEDFADYIGILKQGDPDELPRFRDAVTTNLTAFFRESHHFQVLADQVFPDLVQRNEDLRRIRIWSAGCSSGEEPYSIAMVAREAFPPEKGWDVRILASDLDSRVVEKARQGIYTLEQVQSVGPERLRRFFRRGKGSNEGYVRVRPELKQMIRFQQFNIFHRWPIGEPLDVIFCRNLIIYFDQESKRGLVDRMADALVDSGYLFLGHSESLHNLTDRFRLLGRTAYRKAG